MREQSHIRAALKTCGSPKAWFTRLRYGYGSQSNSPDLSLCTVTSKLDGCLQNKMYYCYYCHYCYYCKCYVCMGISTIKTDLVHNKALHIQNILVRKIKYSTKIQVGNSGVIPNFTARPKMSAFSYT